MPLVFLFNSKVNFLKIYQETSDTSEKTSNPPVKSDSAKNRNIETV